MIVRPQPTNIEGNTDLDMRVSPKTGKDLAEEIAESVSHSQLFLQTTLPDRLILTQKQFVSLQHDMAEMDHTEDRIYITPHNVMYVVIDREIDTVQEVENVILETEELKKEIHDHDSTHLDQP